MQTLHCALKEAISELTFSSSRASGWSADMPKGCPKQVSANCVNKALSNPSGAFTASNANSKPLDSPINLFA